MDSHFINEPKRTGDQIASARDAWLNKYIKRKSPEPFKYSTKQLSEQAPQNLPGTTVGNLFGIPTTTADKKKDGSTRVPLPTVNVPYYNNYGQQPQGQQQPTYNANTARTTGVDPNTVQGTTTGTRPPGMPSTTLPTIVTSSSNIPVPTNETIPIEDEPTMQAKIFEEPMDLSRQEIIDETMSYLPYRPISKQLKDMPPVQQYYNIRMSQDNLANAATFMQRRMAAKNLQNDIVKLDKIKEMYDDGVEIHKISQEGLPIKEPLDQFQKKYGTTNTQGVINEAKQMYEKIKDNIALYNPERPIVNGTDTPAGLNIHFDTLEKTIHNIGSSQAIAVDVEEALKNSKVDISKIFDKAGVYNFFSPFYQNFNGFLHGIKDAGLKTIFTTLYYGGYGENPDEITQTLVNMAGVIGDKIVGNEDRYEDMIQYANEYAKTDMSMNANPSNNTVSNPFGVLLSDKNVASPDMAFVQMLESVKQQAVTVGSNFVGVASYLNSFLNANYEDRSNPAIVGVGYKSNYTELENSYNYKQEEGFRAEPFKIQDTTPVSNEVSYTQFPSNNKKTNPLPDLDFPKPDSIAISKAIEQMKETNNYNLQNTMKIDNSKNYYALAGYGMTLYNKIEDSLTENTIDSINEATADIEKLKEVTSMLALAAYSTRSDKPENLEEGLKVANEFPESKAAENIREQETLQTQGYESALNENIDYTKNNIKEIYAQLGEQVGPVNPEIQQVYELCMKYVYYSTISDDNKDHSFDASFDDLDFMNLKAAPLGQDATITQVKIRQHKDFVNLMQSVNWDIEKILQTEYQGNAKDTNVRLIKYMYNRTFKLKDIGSMPLQLEKKQWNWKGVADEFMDVLGSAASAGATVLHGYQRWKNQGNMLTRKGEGIDSDHLIKQIDYDDKIEKIKRGGGIEQIPLIKHEANNYINDLRNTKLNLTEMKPIHRVVDILNSMPTFKMGGLQKKPTYGCSMCGTKAGKGKRFFVHDKNNKDITCSNCFGEHGMTGGRVTERDANFNFIEESKDPEHVQMTEDQKTNDYLDEVENIKPTTAFEDFDYSADIDKKFLDRMSSDFVVNRPYDYRKSFEAKDLDRLAYLIGMHEHASEQMTTSQKANMEALAINHLDRYKDPKATFVNPNKLSTFGGTRSELQQNPGFLKRYLQ